MHIRGRAGLVAVMLLVPLPALADSAGQVADVWPGTSAGVPHLRANAAVYAGQLYFPGQDALNNVELWRYDGVDPPALAADINPSGGSYPYELAAFGDRLCFAAENAAIDVELYCYDGTSPPQKIDVNPTASSTPTSLVVLGEQLYFFAQGDSMGRELWRYDGTNPPVRVTDLAPGSFSAFANDVNDDMVVWHGQLYFIAADGTADRELYSYDGVDPPVKLSNSIGSAERETLVVVGPYLCFGHSDSSSGGQSRAWCYDGTNPPEQLSPTLALQGNMAAFDGDLYMWGYEQAVGSETGIEMWRWDGTALTRVDPNVGTSFGLPDWQVFAGALYFLNGSRLMRFDGVSEPVEAVPGTHPRDGAITFAGRLFFTGSSAAGGYELWALQPSSPELWSDGFEKYGAELWSTAFGLDGD